MDDETRSKLEAINSLGNRVKNLIAPFEKMVTNESKNVELWQVGKFIITLDESIQLTEMREKPDFVIQNGDSKAGLELVRLFDEEKRKIENSAEQLIKKAQNVFMKKYPDLTCYVNFNFVDNPITFSKNNVDIIAQSIAEYVFNSIHNTISKKPDFIDELTIFKNNSATLFQIMGAYGVPRLTKSIVENIIRSKEKKIDTYKANTGEMIQWLLIVVAGTSVSSDFYYVEEDIYNIKSHFDKVYIFKDFQAEILELK